MLQDFYCSWLNDDTWPSHHVVFAHMCIFPEHGRLHLHGSHCSGLALAWLDVFKVHANELVATWHKNVHSIAAANIRWLLLPNNANQTRLVCDFKNKDHMSERLRTVRISNVNTFHCAKPSNTDCLAPAQQPNWPALSCQPAFHGNTTATYLVGNDAVFSAHLHKITVLKNVQTVSGIAPMRRFFQTTLHVYHVMRLGPRNGIPDFQTAHAFKHIWFGRETAATPPSAAKL